MINFVSLHGKKEKVNYILDYKIDRFSDVRIMKKELIYLAHKRIERRARRICSTHSSSDPKTCCYVL